MKNIAKCKLCNTVIESFHSQDFVDCKCGEISVFGGASLECAAKNWDNFRRLDDKGNEIIPRIEDVKPLDTQPLSRKEELLGALQDMIDSYERLPSYAMGTPCTNADMLGMLMIVRQLFLFKD